MADEKPTMRLDTASEPAPTGAARRTERAAGGGQGGGAKPAAAKKAAAKKTATKKVAASAAGRTPAGRAAGAVKKTAAAPGGGRRQAPGSSPSGAGRPKKTVVQRAKKAAPTFGGAPAGGTSGGKVSKKILGTAFNPKLLIAEYVACSAVLAFGTIVAPQGSKDGVPRAVVKFSALSVVFFVLGILSAGGKGAAKAAAGFGFIIMITYLFTSSDAHNIAAWLTSFYGAPASKSGTTGGGTNYFGPVGTAPGDTGNGGTNYFGPVGTAPGDTGNGGTSLAPGQPTTPGGIATQPIGLPPQDGNGGLVPAGD